jgi:hypothetical protein
MVEPSLALWTVEQKMPAKGCRRVVDCTVTSLAGLPELHGDCLLTGFGSL